MGPGGYVRVAHRPSCDNGASQTDAVAISLFAKGLANGEVSAHFQEVYGASIRKDTVSRITDKMLDETATWTSRPLQRI